jgi:hypothetical protein
MKEENEEEDPKNVQIPEIEGAHAVEGPDACICPHTHNL